MTIYAKTWAMKTIHVEYVQLNVPISSLIITISVQKVDTYVSLSRSCINNKVKKIDDTMHNASQSVILLIEPNVLLIT